MSTYDKSQEPMVISKYSMDKMLKLSDPAKAIALYSFYYYTAKWQGTDQPKASISYCCKALKMGENTVRKIKKELQSIGLLGEDVKRKDDASGKVTGWFVKVNFVWQKPPSRNDECGDKNHPHGLPQGGNESTNALNTNSLNALKTNIIANQKKIDSEKPKQKQKKDDPPAELFDLTQQDVIAYYKEVVDEKGIKTDRAKATIFCESYLLSRNDTEWVKINGRPVKNWKNDFRQWVNRAIESDKLQLKGQQ